ncbi:MAG: hypothetical protein ACJ793_11975 [Gemmatimonadaceae bacterium]
MSESASSSAALPIAYAGLRALVVANWLMAVMILVLLLAMPTRRWIMVSLNLDPGAEAERVIMGFRTIAVIGLIGVPFNHIVLKRLLSIVETVRWGEPFVVANADRLQTIAWALLVLQVLSIIIGTIAKSISSPAHPIKLNAGFSIAGWLAVLLTFILARVFAEGAVMREDLAGMV